jgi:predicted DNA-binding mobile mystery protein A
MNKKLFQTAMRDQIQEYTNLFKKALDKPRPREGWIKAIRNALGMSSYQLAKRMNYKQTSIIAFEKREQEGTISLKSLQQVAKALNCHFIYAFVPENDLEEILENQARAVLRAQTQALGHSMQLEQQGLTPQQQKRNEDLLVKEMLQGSLRKLWEKA